MGAAVTSEACANAGGLAPRHGAGLAAAGRGNERAVVVAVRVASVPRRAILAPRALVTGRAFARANSGDGVDSGRQGLIQAAGRRAEALIDTQRPQGASALVTHRALLALAAGVSDHTLTHARSGRRMLRDLTGFGVAGDIDR